MDVWIQYRKYPAKDLSTRETGWNIFSKDRVKDFLMNKLKVRSVEFIPFELSFDMDPNEEDFARSWTFKLENGERKFTNGLSIICNLEILRFIK